MQPKSFRMVSRNFSHSKSIIIPLHLSLLWEAVWDWSFHLSLGYLSCTLYQIWDLRTTDLAFSVVFQCPKLVHFLHQAHAFL